MVAEAVENRGPQLLAVNITFVALAFLATVLRCYVRVGLVKAFGADDWAMVFAMASFVLYISCSITGVHYGTGQHRWNLSDYNSSQAMKFWYFCYLFYSTTMITSKISIGWFLLRITVTRFHAWTIYLAVALTVITGIVFFFVTLFQCHPVSYFWNKNQDGTCVNADIIIALAYLYSALNVISDFILAVLPIVLISKLQMERRTKFILSPLLAMGCVASSAVAVRFPYLHQIKNPDFLYATTDTAIWSTIEQGLAITAGSLATTRPLFKRLGFRLRFSKESTAATPGGNQSALSYGNGKIQVTNEFSLARFKQQDKVLPDVPTHDLETGKSMPDKHGYFWQVHAVTGRENSSEEELQRAESKEVAGSITPKSFLASDQYK